jgi:hypothetical protein
MPLRTFDVRDMLFSRQALWRDLIEGTCVLAEKTASTRIAQEADDFEGKQ